MVPALAGTVAYGTITLLGWTFLSDHSADYSYKDTSYIPLGMESVAYQELA